MIKDLKNELKDSQKNLKNSKKKMDSINEIKNNR